MSEESPSPRKRPRWRKKRWWSFFLLIGLLVWLDGPGWRWLGQRVAAAYLPDMGYDVSFQLEGRLTSGPVRVVGLTLDSETAIHRARVDGLEIRYSLLEAIKGKVEAIEANGIEIEVDLAALPEKEEPEQDKEPLDLEKTLSDLRERLIPVGIAIEDLQVRIRRGDEAVFSLASTNLHHQSGDSDFRFELGEMRIPGDRSIPAQAPTLSWLPKRYEIDHLALLEEISLKDVSATLGTTPDYAGTLLIGGSRIKLQTNLETIRLELSDQAVSFSEIERIAKIELPVEGSITAIDAEILNFTEGTSGLNGKLGIKLEDFNYDDWRSDSIQLNAELIDDKINLTAELDPGGSPLIMNGEVSVNRERNFLPTEANANLRLTRIQQILTTVQDRYRPDENAPSPPDGMLTVDANCIFGPKGQPQSVNADLAIAPSGEAPPVKLKASWKPEEAVDAELSLPNLDFDGTFTPETVSYQGSAQVREFSPESLTPWLLPFGIELPSGMKGTLEWSGGGNIPDVTHSGNLKIESFEWQNGDPASNPLIRAVGDARYEWPKFLELESLEVGSGDQRFSAKALLQERTLSVEELRWSEGDTVLANGTAKIPLAENPADWRQILKQTRPIQLELSTPELAFTRLHPFLPESVRFPAASKGSMNISLEGTPANPTLNARFEAADIGITEQPDIPPADILFEVTASEETLKVDGEISVPGYPKAVITGVTSWLPAQWAMEPDSATEAPLDAELRISNFNLAPFATHLPNAKQLTGTIDIQALVTGTVSKPVPRASIKLRDASLDWHKAGTPDVDSASMEIDLTEEQVEIKKLSASVAAGTIDLTGTVGLEKFKPSELDLKLKCEAIPAVRNASTVVRLSTDLTLTGPWETARLGGSISIIDSLLFKDFELLPIGGPINHTAEPSLPSVDSDTPAEKLAAIPEPFKNWGLDLSLKSITPFLIRGNLAGGEVYLDAKVGGTVGKPRPTGGVKLREIEAQLPFSTLTIPMGSVDFNPDRPFNPTLDIKGESTVRPYDIEIHIYGGLSNPTIQTSSNPPLPENEVMTLIATGTTTAGLADPTAATARAAQLVIEEMRRGRIGAVKSLRPIFKLLDKVDFQVGEQAAYSSTTFNSVTFNLDENWLLTAGISDEGYTRAKVTYLFRFR